MFYREVDLGEAVRVLYQPNLPSCSIIPNQITTGQLVAPIWYLGFQEQKTRIVVKSLSSNLGYLIKPGFLITLIPLNTRFFSPQHRRVIFCEQWVSGLGLWIPELPSIKQKS